MTKSFEIPRWLRLGCFMLALIMIFSLCVIPQPSFALAGLDDVAIAGLCAAFFCAAGCVLTCQGMDRSGVTDYMLDQLHDYTQTIGSTVSGWIDTAKLKWNSFTQKVVIPASEAIKMNNFVSWFSGRNSIDISSTTSVLNYSNSYFVGADNAPLDLYSISMLSSYKTSKTLPLRICPASIGDSNSIYISGHNFIITRIKDRGQANWCEIFVDGFLLGTYGWSNDNAFISFGVYQNQLYIISAYVDGVNYTHILSYPISTPILPTTISYSIDAVAGDVIGIPDLEDREQSDAVVVGLDQVYSGSFADALDRSTALSLEEALTDVLDWTAAGEAEALNTAVVSEAEGEAAATETVEGVSVNAAEMANDANFKTLITTRFPWCIPWDFVAAVRAFRHEPITPEIEVDLFGDLTWGGMDLSDTAFTLDFSTFDKIAAVSRWATTVIFCAGLALITRKLIWR